MPLGEFDIIARYFSRSSPRGDVLLGVGDDAALLTPAPGQALVAATDTLVEGRHFLAGTPADAIGHQALAVNLSDLAAMGAEPAWALLSLSMPQSDERWLAGFADGLYALAERHGVALVGGDTVSGPLVVTIEVLGFVPPAEALRRSGARAGRPHLRVRRTGRGCGRARGAAIGPGDASSRRMRACAASCAPSRGSRWGARCAASRRRRWTSRMACSATSASSRVRAACGACIDLERLPLAPELAAYPLAEQERLVLHGGDDYELLFTLPADHFGHVAATRRGRRLQPAVHRLDGGGRRASSAVATARA